MRKLLTPIVLPVKIGVATRDEDDLDNATAARRRLCGDPPVFIKKIRFRRQCSKVSWGALPVVALGRYDPFGVDRQKHLEVRLDIRGARGNYQNLVVTPPTPLLNTKSESA